MKKILLFLAVLFVGITSTSAMTESELEAKLTKKYEVNGVTFQAKDSQKNLIKSYLKTYDISSSEADYISKKLDEAFDVLKKSGKKSFYDLSSADKKKIIALVADVSSNTSVKAAIEKIYLVVYKPNSNEVFHKEPIYPTENGDIQQTSRNITLVVAGLISMAGIALAIKKIKNA